MSSKGMDGVRGTDGPDGYGPPMNRETKRIFALREKIWKLRADRALFLTKFLRRLAPKPFASASRKQQEKFLQRVSRVHAEDRKPFCDYEISLLRALKKKIPEDLFFQWISIINDECLHLMINNLGKEISDSYDPS